MQVDDNECDAEVEAKVDDPNWWESHVQPHLAMH